MVEGVVHVLDVIVHHVHIASSALDQWQLFDIRVLIVAVRGVANVVSSFCRHGTFLIVSHLQVWQFLLCLHWLLLRGVNLRYF